MSGNCDPLTLTYVAGGFTIVGGIIGVLTGHFLTKSRESTNSSNIAIDKWIDIVSGEIQRIKGEKYTKTTAIGDTSTIESMLSTIKITNPEISLSVEWETYYANEHGRRYQEPDKKTKAIGALEAIIHVLQSHKT